jgi:hypothetical protein
MRLVVWLVFSIGISPVGSVMTYDLGSSTLEPPFTQVDGSVTYSIAPISYRQGCFDQISENEPFTPAGPKMLDRISLSC